MHIQIIEEVSSGEKSIPSASVEVMKQAARKLKREQSITHTEALDAVAQRHGFHHWHHVTQANHRFLPVEQALTEGCVLAFDRKDGERIDTSDGTFTEDDRFELLVRDRLFQHYGDVIDEEDEQQRPWKERVSEEVLWENFGNYFMDLMFFRLSEDHARKSLSEIQALIDEYAFFAAEYIWLRGQLTDGFGHP